jgi:hypothetical protein
MLDSVLTVSGKLAAEAYRRMTHSGVKKRGFVEKKGSVREGFS